jgi:hypothetical protein
MYSWANSARIPHASAAISCCETAWATGLISSRWWWTRHGVSNVIRGEDLLASTGRQIRLARMLGREKSPVFAHHPLIFKPSGDKLSKANRDTAVRELRAAGHSAPDVIGRAALAVGLIREFRAVAARDVPELFP